MKRILVLIEQNLEKDIELELKDGGKRKKAFQMKGMRRIKGCVGQKYMNSERMKDQNLKEMVYSARRNNESFQTPSGLGVENEKTKRTPRNYKIGDSNELEECSDLRESKEEYGNKEELKENKLANVQDIAIEDAGFQKAQTSQITPIAKRAPIKIQAWERDVINAGNKWRTLAEHSARELDTFTDGFFQNQTARAINTSKAIQDCNYLSFLPVY